METISASQSSAGVSEAEEVKSTDSGPSSRLRNLWKSLSLKEIKLGSRKEPEKPLGESEKECKTDLEESKSMSSKLSVTVRSGSIRRRRREKVDEITQIASGHSLLPEQNKHELNEFKEETVRQKYINEKNFYGAYP